MRLMAWFVLVFSILLFALSLMNLFLPPDLLMRLHILRRDVEDWGRCAPILGGLAALVLALLLGAAAIVALTR